MHAHLRFFIRCLEMVLVFSRIGELQPTAKLPNQGGDSLYAPPLHFPRNDDRLMSDKYQSSKSSSPSKSSNLQ